MHKNFNIIGRYGDLEPTVHAHAFWRSLHHTTLLPSCMCTLASLRNEACVPKEARLR
jgi:hypothetical protein